MVGGVNSRIYKTTNAGIEWTTMNSPRFANSICFVDTLTGYVGNNIWASSRGNELAKLFKTVDGGISWSSLDIPKTSAVGKFVFLDSGYGYAFFVPGEVQFTSNGGEVWNDVPKLPKSSNYIGLSILGSADVFFLTTNGEVFRFSILQ